MIRKLLVSAMVGAAAMSLSACGDDSGKPLDGNEYSERVVVLRDGRSMPCVTYMGRGITCDWANAK